MNESLQIKNLGAYYSFKNSLIADQVTLVKGILNSGLLDALNALCRTNKCRLIVGGKLAAGYTHSEQIKTLKQAVPIDSMNLYILIKDSAKMMDYIKTEAVKLFQTLGVSMDVKGVSMFSVPSQFATIKFIALPRGEMQNTLSRMIERGWLNTEYEPFHLKSKGILAMVIKELSYRFHVNTEMIDFMKAYRQFLCEHVYSKLTANVGEYDKKVFQTIAQDMEQIVLWRDKSRQLQLDPYVYCLDLATNFKAKIREDMYNIFEDEIFGFILHLNSVLMLKGYIAMASGGFREYIYRLVKGFSKDKPKDYDITIVKLNGLAFEAATIEDLSAIIGPEFQMFMNYLSERYPAYRVSGRFHGEDIYHGVNLFSLDIVKEEPLPNGRVYKHSEAILDIVFDPRKEPINIEDLHFLYDAVPYIRDIGEMLNEISQHDMVRRAKQGKLKTNAERVQLLKQLAELVDTYTRRMQNTSARYLQYLVNIYKFIFGKHIRATLLPHSDPIIHKQKRKGRSSSSPNKPSGTASADEPPTKKTKRPSASAAKPPTEKTEQPSASAAKPPTKKTGPSTKNKSKKP
jgi:hypothetical protein